MKLIKGSFYFLLIMFGAVLLAAVFAPQTNTVDSNITINAPIEVVYSQVSNFRNWEKWDIWYEKDNNQIRTFKGTLGDNVQKFSWQSDNTDIGNGVFIVSGFENNKTLSFQFSQLRTRFNESFTGFIEVEESNDQTEVNWVLQSEKKYPFRILNYFLEKRFEPFLDEGLLNLKNYVESSSAKELGVKDNGVELASEMGVNYVMIKKAKLPMMKLESFFQSSYIDLYDYIKLNNLEPKGSPSGFYFDWDQEDSLTTVAAAIPVSVSVSDQVDSSAYLEYGVAEVYKKKVTMTRSGGYGNLDKAHFSLGQWIQENDKILKYPIIEEYVKGPLDQSDTSTFITKISYFFE